MSTTTNIGFTYKGFDGKQKKAMDESMLYKELRDYVFKYKKLNNDYTGGDIVEYFKYKDIDIGKGYNIKRICKKAAKWLDQFADANTDVHKELEKMKEHIHYLQCRLGIVV